MFRAASDPGRSDIHTMAFRQSEQQAARKTGGSHRVLASTWRYCRLLIIEAHVQAPEVAGESLPDLVLVLSSEWTELGVCPMCVRGDLHALPSGHCS